MPSPPDAADYEVYTFVVVMQAGLHDLGEGGATLPITICAKPGEAEHAARVIAYLELVVLGQGAEPGAESF